MVIAALLGKSPKGQGKRRGLLPSFVGGPVEVSHHLPGRVRFRAQSLVGDQSAKGVLEERLARVEGVAAVRADTRSGSVLI
jgi:hypothetical protein